jgi:hypothetical protein
MISGAKGTASSPGGICPHILVTGTTVVVVLVDGTVVTSGTDVDGAVVISVADVVVVSAPRALHAPTTITTLTTSNRLPSILTPSTAGSRINGMLSVHGWTRLVGGTCSVAILVRVALGTRPYPAGRHDCGGVARPGRAVGSSWRAAHASSIWHLLHRCGVVNHPLPFSE